MALPILLPQLGEFAFYGCGSLTSVTIPKSVIKIDKFAFSSCNGLPLITIPNSVTSIGYSAFYNCTGLTSVTISNSVIEIGGSAFYNTPWYTNQPNGVIYINNVLYVYKGTMPENASIDIKEGTVSISNYAFSGRTGLTEVTIPNSVTEIGREAFSGCTGLTEVSIPNSVTKIGYATFFISIEGLNGLKSIYVYNSIPPTADDYIFSSSTFSDATLYIPTGSKSTYMTTAPWSSFLNIVESDALGVEDILAEGTTVTVQGGAIVVNGVDTPMKIEVYNLQGQRVYSGYETTIPMNERGIYLVKIANRVVKVVL